MGWGLAFALIAFNVFAGDKFVAPGTGFIQSRYASLWTKSPFAVATNDAPAAATTEYQLIGAARFDGISYASVIDKQSQKHLLLSSDKAVSDLTLISVSYDSSGRLSALIQCRGQMMSLTAEAIGTSSSSSPGFVVSIPNQNQLAQSTSPFPPNTMPSRRPFGEMGDAAR